MPHLDYLARCYYVRERGIGWNVFHLVFVLTRAGTLSEVAEL